MAKSEGAWSYIGKSLANFKAALLGYRTYKAFLTQTGTSAPEAFVIENSLGINPSYVYDEAGIYNMYLDKLLFKTATETTKGQKIEVTITTPSSTYNGPLTILSAYPAFGLEPSTDRIGITTLSDNIPTNEILGKYFSSVLEIKVYNK